MQETALYRKYRPQKFKDVVGQEHIVRVLESAIKEGNIAHAYLFSGSRGTGKTSIARIFAREIGCSANDLYEIDAASNRGIDDVRALRDAVSTLPFESPYKVYIVDEVHMLTKEAFNALLKTLEEPPKHVVFILATTELEKLPETVVSRCQAYTFRKPSVEVLKKVVVDVAKKEGFTMEPASAELVAVLGDGSFRDTLGIVQKVISGSEDKKISVAKVEAATGAPRGVLVEEFVTALAEAHAEQGLSVLRRAKESGVDMKVFLTLVISLVRTVLLYRFAPEMHASLKADLSEAGEIFVKAVAEKKESRLSSRTLSALLDVQAYVGVSYADELPLELLCIRMAEEGKK